MLSRHSEADDFTALLECSRSVKSSHKVHDIKPSTSNSFGIYTLGNDTAYEFLCALFTSLREYHPIVPVTLIPFDSNISRVTALCQRFNVTISESNDLEQYDNIGLYLTEARTAVTQMFRKFACFNGQYDTFVYLDSDFILLEPIDDIIRAAMHRKFFIYEGCKDFKACYTDTVLAEYMEHTYDSHGFNAGFFGSFKGAIDTSKLSVIAACVKQYSHQVWSSGWDQPFLNFVVDLFGLPKASLSEVLGRTTWCWSHNPNLHRRIKKDTPTDCRCSDCYVPMIHYATDRVSWRMPQRHVWLQYRHLHSSFPTRTLYYLYNDVIKRPIYYARRLAAKVGCIRR